MSKHLYFFINLVFLNLAVLLLVNAAFTQTQTFSYSGSLQYFTVPAAITTITIETKGAQGGSSGVNPGGLGARMKGSFVVTPGQQLKILVGGQGGSSSGSAGGGGGSFVTDATNNPLCIAGGGGGAYMNNRSYMSANSGGTIANSGNSGIYDSEFAGSGIAGTGGINGNGGGAYAIYVGAKGSGGGGLLTSGTSGGANSTGGASFISGGAGGSGNGGAGNGGYGGGGGGDNNVNTGSGGGGGYSGGGGGSLFGVGGGGGSFNNGFNQDNSASFNSGNGVVEITWDAGCTGTPYAGTLMVFDSVSNCSGWVHINLMDASNGTGITYQWQSAPDINGLPGTFTDIAGSNTIMFFSAGSITTSTWYRCVVSCTNSSLSDTTRKFKYTILPSPLPGNVMLFPLTGACVVNADLNIMNISWDGVQFQWQSAPDVSGLPGNYTNIPNAVNNFFTQNNVSQTTWYRCVSTCIATNTSANSDSAKITISPVPESGMLYATNTNGDCSLNSYLYLSGGSYGDSLSYIWQSASDNAGIPGLFSDIAGETSSTYSPVNIMQTTWYRCIVICKYSNEKDTSNNVLITINSLNGGSAVSNLSQVCNGVGFTLSLSGASASGVNYQWQSASDVSGSPGTFSNILGANNASYSLTQTATKWYRCVLTCTSGGNSVNSSNVKVVLVNACYCTASGGGNYEHIQRVQLGSINNLTAYSTYTDYTNLSTSVIVGNSYPITVTLGSPYSGDQCGVWVDWNQDGDFYDAGETISLTGVSVGPYSGTIIPPAGAIAGNTRMRVRVIYTGTISPCGTTSFGEVEDYTINVVPIAVYASVTIASDYTTVCQGATVNFTATPINGGSSPVYQWKVNNVNSGTNSTVFSYTPTNNDVVSCIMTSNLSGVLGNPDTSNYITLTVNPYPSPAGVISGNNLVCQGQIENAYNVPVINNASTYIWTLPTGAVGSSSSRSIVIDYSVNAISSPIKVKGHNSCGDGAESSLSVVVEPLPSNAGVISGTTTVCQNQTGLTYSVPVINNAVSYSWTLPTGATGTSTTNIISVNYGANSVSGNITVRGVNGCGDGVVSTLAITVNPLPATAGSITGSSVVCQGQNNVVYNVPLINNATSYIWTLTNGASGSSTSNSITLNFLNTATSGNITVKGSNLCGEGGSSGKTINVNPLPLAAGVISGSSSVCQGDPEVGYSLPVVTYATSYIWSLPMGVSGSSTTRFINTNFGTSAQSGNITVKGSNSCGEGNASTLAVNVFPLPSNAGVISGTTSVCQGQSSITYSVPAIADADSYFWTLPNGATGSSTTNSIIVSYSNSAISGNITVKGLNSCGYGVQSSLAITVNPLPASASAISGPSSVCTNQNNVIYIVAPIANATSYTWTLPTGASGNSSTNSISVNYTAAAISGNITVKGINSCGEGLFSSMAISVNTPSTNPSSISGNTTICNGSSTTLSVLGGSLGLGATWKWYNDSCGGVFVNSGASITVNPAVTKNYYVRAENACNLTNCINTTVVVNNVSVSANSIGGKSSICVGENATLVINGGSLGTGAIWKWYEGACSGNSIGNGTSIVVSPSVSKTYYVRAEGVCNTTACVSFTLNVNTLSVAAVSITGTVSQCAGVSSVLSVSGGSLGNGASWKWYSGSCGGVYIGSGTSITINPLVNTTYYVRAEGPCDTTTCVSRNVIAATNRAPSLTYSNNSGFTSHLVSPYDGTPTNIYRFEVKYSDADGDLPAATYPRLQLDFEGNGNYANANDKMYYMLEVDPSDLNVVDGKNYYYIATTLQESADWKTLITAVDPGGCAATIGPLDEPNIIRESDISIFANDISFSDANPDPGDMITVSAVIHNYSGRSADNFVVHLVNQFEPTTVFPDQTVAHLGAYSSTTISWNIQTPALPAWCPMQVFIDYSNVLTEPNELDNQAIRPFTNGNYTLPGKIVITANTNPTSIPQGSSVNVCGNAWYSGTAVQLLDSSCAGATVTYTVVETGQTGSTYTNSLGNYCIGIHAPYPAGTYHVNMHITDYTLNGDTTTQFDIYQVVCPDLTVSNITMGPQTLTPHYPCHYNGCVNILHGHSLSGSITVSNTGNAASTATTLRVDCPDGLPAIPTSYPIPALNPGATYNVPISLMTFNTVGGTYINATVDYGNLVAECNENNSNSLCIMVHPDRDIVPSAYIYPSNNECNFNNISVLLDNPGGQATGLFYNRLMIYKGGVLQATLYDTVLNIPALYCKTITFNWPSPHTVGLYNFVFEADYLSNVSETNELNNTLNLSTTLTGCKADLSVYGCTYLKVDPVDPQQPGNINIFATIVNNGMISAGNFNVNFNINGNITIYPFVASLAPGQSQEISITVPTPPFGNNGLIVTVDATNLITESNEANNTATASLCWEFNLSDFGYSCYGAAFWNHTQIKNQPVVFDVGLHNDGIYKASNVKIKFEVSGPGLPAGWLNLGNASTFAGSTACYCAFGVYHTANPFAFPQTGDYLVRITADPDNDYIECNEGNNVLIVTVHVSDMPDYRVLSQYIAPSKLNPELNEPIGIDITYENIGITSTDSVNFYTKVDNTHLYTIRVPGLINGTFATVHVAPSWSSNLRGIHIIRTIIDKDNEVNESNELNNEATRAICVGQSPNLIFTAFNISDTLAAYGSTVFINATVKNIGYDLCDATYSLYYLFNNNEVLIGQQPISLDTSESITLTIPWAVVNTNTTIIGRISNGSPLEYDITDNEARQKIGGAIQLTFTTSQPSCYGYSNGKAKVIIGGAQPPYTILWNTGQTVDSITGPAGAYSVTVTDINGLTATRNVTITQPPTVPVSINITTSTTNVCPFKSVPFYATPTNGGSIPIYQWRKNGFNVGTNSSTFSYLPENGDTISCSLISNINCASGNPANSNNIIMSLKPLAAAAGSITGAATVCQGQSAVVYQINPVANATMYHWTLPAGAIANSVNNNISINFSDTSVSGDIVVKGGNDCGYGEPSVKTITVNLLPSSAGIISGAVDVLKNQNNIVYTVGQIANASAYSWTLPNGFTGSGTNGSITVSSGANAYSGFITVKGQNNCGYGQPSSLLVKIPKLLNIKVLLEGFFNHISESMNKVQDMNGDHFSGSTVDTITVKIANPFIPYTIRESYTTNIDVNGNISELLLPGSDTGNYYIVIKHRNHLELWSKNAISFDTDIINYNFTTNINKAFGNNQKQLSPGKVGMMVGDVNQDGVVDLSDLVDMDSDLTFGTVAYIVYDLNGDGVVDLSDLVSIDENLANGVIVITP